MQGNISQYGFMLFCYAMFLLAINTGYKSGSGQLKDVLSGKAEPGMLFIQLITGICFLGMGAAIIYTKSHIDNAILTPAWHEYGPLTWTLMLLAMMTGFLSVPKKIIPSFSSTGFLPFHLPLSFVLIRTLFLIVYEIFFRGVMLFVMIGDFGVVIAVILNQVFYVIVHWFNKKERYCSVLMGIALCAVSIYYQNVWPAIVIHLSLALSHEITLLVKNKSLIKRSCI
jgi:membrane protease YdiL (CAAX protease family)